jgi:XTP/dITP diphosphohydrolase
VQVLLASENPKKLRELEPLLERFGIEVRTPSSVGGLPDVVEDQPTFAGNARLKARSGALAKGLWCLADDSGLEVDALDGQPGVLSARFAGAHGDDAANNALLLEKLAHLPDPERGARFVSALCLCRPDGSSALEVEGTARGRILRQPRGRGDFGYDPLFLFTEQGFAQTGRAFAELEPAQKAAVSHRGRALREFLARLPDIRDR